MVQAVCVVPERVRSVRRAWDSGDGSMGVGGAQCSRATSCAAWWMCAEGRRMVVRRGQQRQQARAALLAMTKAATALAVATTLTADSSSPAKIKT